MLYFISIIALGFFLGALNFTLFQIMVVCGMVFIATQLNTICYALAEIKTNTEKNEEEEYDEED